MSTKRTWVSVLVLFWALIFLARPGEMQLKMDAMTYSAVAKHMATSGDWQTPRLTPSAYSAFYQHPPLALWIQATMFKWFGASVFVARLFPALCALGTLLILLEWSGPAAPLILLTTPGYLKYGSDFLMDGPLAFFLVAGSFAFLRGRWSYFGLALAAALMTKGMAALSLPVATLLVSRGRVKTWFAGLAMAAVPIAIWIAFGGGHVFLQHYFAESVSGRLSGATWSDHLRPIVGVAEAYWPWLPVFLFGIIRADRLAVLHALIVIGGYCKAGHYYEHYLVGFYPFAAIVAAAALPALAEKWTAPLLKVGMVAAVLAAVLPFRLRGRREEPIRNAAPWARDHCNGVREALISDHLSEKWLGLAVTLWETNWEATSVSLPVGGGAESLLLAAPGDPPGEGWQVAAAPSEKPFVIYRRYGSSVGCRPE